MMCDAYMCMGANIACGCVGVNGACEAGASDFRFVARGLVETDCWIVSTTVSCWNPATEALDSAEEWERTAAWVLA